MITVLLVRHADIDLPPGSNDPPLNAKGRARADTLAHLAGSAGVTTVFTSTFNRTKQTAGPLAARLGLQPQIAPPPATFARQVLSGTFGEVIVVAGHSDTVPQMIAALGASPPAIGEREFDNLFVVAVPQSAQAGVTRLKYGQP
jgi:phosphohistidine phosphatase SixA